MHRIAAPLLACLPLAASCDHVYGVTAADAPRADAPRADAARDAPGSAAPRVTGTLELDRVDTPPFARDASVGISFATALGPADLYAVVLDELVLAGGATTLASRYVGLTSAQSTRIDPALLVAGHTYVMSVGAILGEPDVATGDFRSLTFPGEEATSISRAFLVPSP